jgi:type I pantothenate kinase
VDSAAVAEPGGSPFVTLDRPAWAARRERTPLPLRQDELDAVRGLGEPVDLREVEEVYLPLSRLLNLHVRAAHARHRLAAEFLGTADPPVPFVIAVAGSVAVGKSTTARLLRLLLARWPEHPRVDLVATDGFLLPNAELRRRGLMERKGFPESYDRRALLAFVTAVKSGVDVVRAPAYSHLVYDVVPDQEVVVDRPDVLILEGLNVLQPPRPRADGSYGLAVSDFFDFSVYVDAHPEDVRSWYVERFLRLRRTAFADERSHFHRYAALDDAAAVEEAGRIWDTINGPNLRENVEPTRGRASVVLAKGPDHAVTHVRLRRT